MPPRRQRWTEAEDRQIAKLSKIGKTAEFIAEEIGRSVEGVRQRMRGIKLRGTIKLISRRYVEGQL